MGGWGRRTHLAVDDVPAEMLAEVGGGDAVGVVHEAVDGAVALVLVRERFQERRAACARAAQDDCETKHN